MNQNLQPLQFSAYDERPDPKRPGQQGVLFRHEAPARGTPDERRGISYNQYGDRFDARRERGRATEEMPDDGILFHGTSSRLRPGSMIVPGHEPNFEAYHPGTMGTGGYGRSHDVNREHAFATPNLHDAYRYARVSQDVQSTNRETHRGAYVYRVQPTGPVQIDVEDDNARNYGGQAEAFQTKKAFRVIDRVPNDEAEEHWRSYNEDELGADPGSYQFAPKTRSWY